MKTAKELLVGMLASALIVAGASTAQAQVKMEVGASLMGVSFGLGDEDATIFAVGSGVFGTLTPGVYASFFLGDRVGLGPQVSFVAASFGDDDTLHALNLAAQFDYFFSGIDKPSAYVFASAGLVSVSDADYTPKVFGFGAGYRMPVGDRIDFRFDGRYAHYTSEFEGTDALIFTVTLGGRFGG